MLRVQFLVLVGIVTAVLGIALALAWPYVARKAAAVTGPSFSLAVIGGACHPSGAGTDCDIAPSSTFTLSVSLTKTNLPEYRGFQVKLTSPSELPYVDRPRQQEIVWPDCEIGYDDPTHPPAYLAGCTRIYGHSSSVYLGEMLEVDYRCGAASSLIYTITMLQGSIGDATYLVDDKYHFVEPEGGPSKSLTVRCNATTTPAPTGTPAGPTATAVNQSPTPTLTSMPSPTSTQLSPTATAVNQSPTPIWISTPSPMPLTSTPTPLGLEGDVDCDGSVDPTDAELILQLEAAYLTHLSCQPLADVNRDGRTNAEDATLILQYVAGLLPSLECGPVHCLLLASCKGAGA